MKGSVSIAARAGVGSCSVLEPPSDWGLGTGGIADWRLPIGLAPRIVARSGHLKPKGCANLWHQSGRRKCLNARSVHPGHPPGDRSPLGGPTHCRIRVGEAEAWQECAGALVRAPVAPPDSASNLHKDAQGGDWKLPVPPAGRPRQLLFGPLAAAATLLLPLV